MNSTDQRYRKFRSIIQVLPILILVSCSHDPDRQNTLQGWEQIQNRYASFFQVLEKGEQRVVITFGPAGRSDTVGIYSIGDTSVEGARSVPALTNVIVASTTQLPFFTALQKEELISGAVHLSDVFDPKIKELAGSGKIQEVGTADGIDQELIRSIQPQVIFDHPFGQNLRGPGSQVPVIHITEYLEQHPLGRAEWLKVFGLLLNEEQKAIAHFDRIEERYRKEAASIPNDEIQPVVFFASSWQGQWFAPPANSYMARLIEDAGAEYSLADRQSDGNIPMDLETVLHKVRRADHFGMILSTTDTVTAAKLAAGEERLRRIPAVNEGGFYGNSAKYDLFGQAVLEPDLVLADLRNIFHPPAVDTVEFHYFEPLNRPLSADPLDRQVVSDIADR